MAAAPAPKRRRRVKSAPVLLEQGLPLPLLLPLPLPLHKGPLSQGNFRGHYDCMSLPRKAPRAEVLKAYRSMAPRRHPDKNPELGSGPFQQLLQAFECLYDEESRSKYDAHLLDTGNADGVDVQLEGHVDAKAEAPDVSTDMRHALVFLAAALAMRVETGAGIVEGAEAASWTPFLHGLTPEVFRKLQALLEERTTNQAPLAQGSSFRCIRFQRTCREGGFYYVKVSWKNFHVKTGRTNSVDEAIRWHAEMERLKSIALQRIAGTPDDERAVIQAELSDTMQRQPRICLGFQFRSSGRDPCTNRRFTVDTPLTENLKLALDFHLEYERAALSKRGTGFQKVKEACAAIARRDSMSRVQTVDALLASASTLEYVRRREAVLEPLHQKSLAPDRCHQAKLSTGLLDLLPPWFPRSARGLGLGREKQHAVVYAMRRDPHLNTAMQDSFLRHAVRPDLPLAAAASACADGSSARQCLLASSPALWHAPTALKLADAAGAPERMSFAPRATSPTPLELADAPGAPKDGRMAASSQASLMPGVETRLWRLEETRGRNGVGHNVGVHLLEAALRFRSGALTLPDLLVIETLALTCQEPAGAAVRSVLQNCCISHFLTPPRMSRRGRQQPLAGAQQASKIHRLFQVPRFAAHCVHISLEHAPRELFAEGEDLPRTLRYMPQLRSVTFASSAWGSPYQRQNFIHKLQGRFFLFETAAGKVAWRSCPGA